MRWLMSGLLRLASKGWARVGRGQRAPDFSLPALAGGKVELARLRGKVVLVDFWAQWCEPCKRELPELEKLHRKYAQKVVVLGISIDKQRENAARMVRQLGLTFQVLFDPAGTVAAVYDLPNMPSSYFVDARGVVRFVHEGFEGGADVTRFEHELDELVT